MDVRAADTSGLAAKRLEFESVQPIKEKHGFMENQDAVRSPRGPDEQNRRPKPHKDPGHDWSDEQVSPQDAQESGDQDTAAYGGEQHILDVRV